MRRHEIGLGVHGLLQQGIRLLVVLLSKLNFCQDAGCFSKVGIDFQRVQKLEAGVVGAPFFEVIETLTIEFSASELVDLDCMP